MSHPYFYFLEKERKCSVVFRWNTTARRNTYPWLHLLNYSKFLLSHMNTVIQSRWHKSKLWYNMKKILYRAFSYSQSSGQRGGSGVYLSESKTELLRTQRKPRLYVMHLWRFYMLFIFNAHSLLPLPSSFPYKGKQRKSFSISSVDHKGQ